MATRLLPPGYQEFDADGAIASGAKLYTYSAGTSTPKATYDDSALTVANANPVVADGSGRFGDIFAGVGSYRLVMTEADGTTLWTADPVDGADGGGGSGGVSTGNLLVNGDFRLNQRGFTYSVNVPDAQYAADGWYVLEQSNLVGFDMLSNPEDGQTTAGRLTQSNVTAQRMGIVQFVPSDDCRHLRNADVVVAGRIRCSVSQPIRYAILEWTGTADTPTIDVVNDWTSASYTAGGFFISSSTVVVATGSLTPAANVWTTLPDLTGTVSGSMNNLVFIVWTQGTIAQNATLDLGLLRLNAGDASQAFDRRALALEKLLTVPDPDLNVRSNSIWNGGMEVWQRGSSISIAASTTATASIYTADGWCLETSANQAMTVSRQSGMTDQSQYCALIQRNFGQTGTAALLFQHPLELTDIVKLRGKLFSVVFNYATGADFAGTMRCKLYCGTGSEGRRTNAAAYTGETTPLDALVPDADGYAQHVFTSSAIMPTNATQASLVFEWTPSGTAGAADAFKIDNVQLNPGAPMLYVHRAFADDLRASQRWFSKSFPYATAPAQNAGTTGAASWPQMVGASTATQLSSIPFSVRMRAAPTVTLYNPSAANAQVRNAGTGTDCASSTATGTEWGFNAGTTSPGFSAAGQQLLAHYTAEASL